MCVNCVCYKNSFDVVIFMSFNKDQVHGVCQQNIHVHEYITYVNV